MLTPEEIEYEAAVDGAIGTLEAEAYDVREALLADEATEARIEKTFEVLKETNAVYKPPTSVLLVPTNNGRYLSAREELFNLIEEANKVRDGKRWREKGVKKEQETARKERLGRLIAEAAEKGQFDKAAELSKVKTDKPLTV